MPTADWRVEFFRRAFLRHAPRRYALMLTPDEAQRLGQKYVERHGMITDTMIARHLTGAISLAASAAIDHRAHLLPLDIDAGGIAAIRALIAAALQQELWAFGQYCLRQGLADEYQRGVCMAALRYTGSHRSAPGARYAADRHDQPAQMEGRATCHPRRHSVAVGTPSAYGALRQPGDRRSVYHHRPGWGRRARRAALCLP
jgi:hypothetical protein